MKWFFTQIFVHKNGPVLFFHFYRQFLLKTSKNCPRERGVSCVSIYNKSLELHLLQPQAANISITFRVSELDIKHPLSRKMCPEKHRWILTLTSHICLFFPGKFSNKKLAILVAIKSLNYVLTSVYNTLAETSFVSRKKTDVIIECLTFCMCFIRNIAKFLHLDRFFSDQRIDV